LWRLIEDRDITFGILTNTTNSYQPNLSNHSQIIAVDKDQTVKAEAQTDEEQEWGQQGGVEKKAPFGQAI
jgi:hypothetical protein